MDKRGIFAEDVLSFKMMNHDRVNENEGEEMHGLGVISRHCELVSKLIRALYFLTTAKRDRVVCVLHHYQ